MSPAAHRGGFTGLFPSVMLASPRDRHSIGCIDNLLAWISTLDWSLDCHWRGGPERTQASALLSWPPVLDAHTPRSAHRPHGCDFGVAAFSASSRDQRRAVCAYGLRRGPFWVFVQICPKRQPNIFALLLSIACCNQLIVAPFRRWTLLQVREVFRCRAACRRTAKAGRLGGLETSWRGGCPSLFM
jgi:hypothetical protein